MFRSFSILDTLEISCSIFLTDITCNIKLVWFGQVKYVIHVLSFCSAHGQAHKCLISESLYNKMDLSIYSLPCIDLTVT
jgi:hypothetical protein